MTLAMNSHENLCFLFSDKEFLHKAMIVLRTILMSGESENKSVVINIKDNKIFGDLKAFNNAKM